MSTVRQLTCEYIEPWLGNIIDLTLSDGSHRIGLLEKVDAEFAQLKATPGNPIPSDGGLVRISGTVSIMRASRN